LATSARRPAAPRATAQRAPGTMGLLPFAMPPFTRVAWVGDEACDVWKPRIERVRAAWTELEWRTVLAGVRSCGIVLAARGTAPGGAAGRADLRLKDQETGGGVASGRPADPAPRAGARPPEEEGAVGRFVGFRACCRAARRRAWADGLDDLTWPAAVATPDAV